MLVQYDIIFNIITILILLFVLYKESLAIDRQTRTILFIKVLWYTTLIALFVIINDLLTGHTSIAAYYAQVLISDIRMGFSGIVSCYWCIYVMCANPERRKWLFKKNRYQTFKIPAYFLLAISLLSFFTNSISFVERETNRVISGDLFFLQIAITYAYFSIGSSFVLFRFIRRKYEKRLLFTKFLYIVLPLSAGVAHFFIREIGFIWVTIALLLMMEHIDRLEIQVSRDALTKLNNRGSFDGYIKAALMENYATLYLIMIDVDYFKKINDTYGHVEGDNALVTTAAILKFVCSKTGGRSCFLARYGGDEFAILYNTPSFEKATELRSEIVKTFESNGYVESEGGTFKIHISTGIARAQNTSERDLIANADKSLYEDKQLNHERLNAL